MRNLLMRTIFMIVLLALATFAFATDVFSTGFESGNPFTLVQGTTGNLWYTGATGVPATGSACAYISGDGGATYTYVVSPTSYVSHMYKDITIPAGETVINLSLKWKCLGEGSYDNLKVFVAPITQTPVANTAFGSTYQLPNSSTYYSGQSTWQTLNITIPGSFAGTTCRLVLSWKNDTSGGSNPPLAVDDIAVTSSAPPLPLATTLIAPADAANLASLLGNTLSWNSVAYATGYKVYYGTDNPPTNIVNGTLQTGTTYTMASPLPIGTYYWKIVPNNATGDATGCPTWSFTAPDPTVTSYPYFLNMEGASSTPALPYGWVSAHTVGTGTNVFYRYSSSTYNHTSGGSYSVYTSSSSVGQEVTLTSPAMNIPSDDYRVNFWMYRATGTSYPTTGIEVYYNTTNTLTGATLLGFIPRSMGVAPIQAGSSSGVFNYIFNLPVGSAGTGRYIIFKAKNPDTGATYLGMALDDIIVEQLPSGPPNPATVNAPANAATWILRTATLNWYAPATGTVPTSYKLYYGTDNPPTNIVNGTDLGNVLTYTPASQMAYSTVYYWKVVPTNANGDCTSAPVWSFTTVPDPTIVTFPYTESFDGTTFPPYGWSNTRLAGTASPGTWDRQTSGSSPSCSPFSGVGMARYNSYSISANNHGGLATPSITVPANNYRVTFRMYREVNSSYTGAKYADEGVSVWFGTSPTDTTLAVKLGYVPLNASFAPVVTTNGWYKYNFNFPAVSAGSGKYVILKAKSQYGDNSFVDDVTIEVQPPVPNPAVMGTPANAAVAVLPTATLNWGPGVGPAPTGYRLYLGTDNPPTNICNGLDLGNVTTYDPADTTLHYSTTYRWQIVPYNADGPAVQGDCPIYSFSTLTTPTAVTTPDPITTATNVDLAKVFGWAASAQATSYDVYMWAPADSASDHYFANVTTNSFTPSPILRAGTAYSWYVVAKNVVGSATGSTWTFTTCTVPVDATTPVPAAAATSVARNVTLSWAAVPGATNYDVYLGTTMPLTPTANVTTNSYQVTTPLLDATTGYVWKVVAKNSAGAAPGAMTWTFTTGYIQAYAASYAGSTVDDDIGQFVFAGIRNPATAPTVFTNNPASANTYSDFTSLAPGHVMRGGTYPVTAYQINSGSFYDCSMAVYIDFNQNGTYDVPDELAMMYNPTASGVAIEGSITIPPTALEGYTGLRVVLDESNVSNPTGTYSWGETEDYVIQVTPPVDSISGYARIKSPLNMAINQMATASLNWLPPITGGLPDGYMLNLGTDNPPTDVQYFKDLGSVLTYLPEEPLAWNTRYYWQIIPYNGLGSPENCPVWSFVTMPDPTVYTFPYSQGFEGSTSFPLAWLNKKTAGTGTSNWRVVTSTVHGGTNSASCPAQTSGTTWQLVSAPMNIPSDDYQAIFWMYRSSSSTSYATEVLNLYYSNNETSTGLTPLVSIHNSYGLDPVVPASGWYPYAANFGTGSAGNGKHLIFEAVSNYGYAFYIDDITVRQIPTLPIVSIISPLPGETDVQLTATLNWGYDTTAPAPTGYKLFLGTDNPPTNMVNGTDLGLVTTYTPTLAYNTNYYWKVVPYNALGDATTSTICQFTTSLPPEITTLPRSYSFDGTSFPPLGWVVSTSNPTYQWVRFTTGSNPTCSPHSGAGMAGYNSFNATAGNYSLLSSAAITMPSEPAQVSFWFYRDSSNYLTTQYETEGVRVFLANAQDNSGATDSLGFVPRGYSFAPAVASAGWYKYTMPFPTSATGTKYLVLKAFSAYGNYMYLDDVTIGLVPPTPPAAVVVSPLSGATMILPNPTLSWTAGVGVAPTGYKVKFGTQATLPDSTTTTSDLGLVTSFAPTHSWTAGTVYYWEVIPYNAMGDCIEPLIWSFTTEPAVTAAATNPNPADVAVDANTTGNLTWTAVSNATAYDVYFGTTLPGSATATVTTNSYTLPTALAYSTTYSWKVVPKNAFGSPAITFPTWTFTTMADPTIDLGVDTTYTQNFDATTFPPLGWMTAKASGTTTNLWARSTTYNHTTSGAASASFYTGSYDNTNQVYLETPPITFPTDNYRLRFWMYRPSGTSYPDDRLTVYYNTSNSMTGATSLVAVARYAGNAPAETAGTGWYQYTVNMPAGSAGTDRHLFFTATCGASYGYFYVDDILLDLQPETPSAADVVSPLNAATLVGPLPTLAWTTPSGKPVTGFKVKFGVSSALPDSSTITQDLGLVNSYTFTTPLPSATTYYWQVIPYNTHGDALECPVWSFATAGLITVAATPVAPVDTAINVSGLPTLSWSNVTNAVEYDVYFGETLPSTPTTTVSTTSWAPGSLTWLTSYTWKVVPKNGYGETAATCPVWSFTTMADPTIRLYPYNQGFEDLSLLDHGWTTTNWTLITPAHSGSYAIGARYTPAGVKTLTSCPFELTTEVDSVSFWWKNMDPDWAQSDTPARSMTRIAGHDTTFFQISTDGITWTTLETLSPVAHDTQYNRVAKDIRSYTGMTVYFRWYYTTDATSSAWGIHLDDLCVNIMSIDPPTDLAVTNNLDDVVLTWTGVPAATSYNVYYATDPYALTWTLLGNTTSTTYTHTAPEGTAYFYKVTSVAGARNTVVSKPGASVVKPRVTKGQVSKPVTHKK